MAEETHDALTSAPWGIAGTVLCIATFGLVCLTLAYYATPDITAFQNPAQETFRHKNNGIISGAVTPCDVKPEFL